MGFDNVVAGNGVSMALIGMAIVFAGLVLVSAFLAVIPRLLDRGETRVRDMARRGAAWRAEHARSTAGTAGARMGGEQAVAGMEALSPEARVAVAYVLQAERERELSMDRQQITQRDGQEQRVWTAIGKMRTLATRL